MLTLQGHTADFRVGDFSYRQNWVYVLSSEVDAGETTTLNDGSTAYPDEVQVNPQLRRAIVERTPAGASDYDWIRAQSRLDDFCARNNIPYLDLLPAFTHSHAQGERLYIENNPHWNDAGNQLAAALLFKALHDQAARHIEP